MVPVHGTLRQALISIEAPPLLAEALRRLLDDGFRLAATERPDGVLLAHAPPQADALAALAARGRESPVAAVVVVVGALDPQLRRDALRAGAMEVVALEGLTPASLAATLDDALARRSFERPAGLDESEERYRALLESIDDGFCIIDVLFDAAGDRAVDYRFVELNASFVRKSGLVDAVGRTARALLPGLDEDWYEIYGRVARTGETARVERHVPAVRRWFEVEAMRVGAPARRRVAVLFRDTTQRHESEVARREGEQRDRDAAVRFETLADNIAQLAWMTDETGTMTWCNRRWLEYTGATLEAVRGWGWQQVHHPDHLARVVEKFRAHLASGEAWEDTFPLRSATGEYRWFLSRAIPIRDAASGATRWFGTNTDVTALREAKEALREADRRKDEFIATLAHELRNPLTPVRNAVEILQRLGSREPQLERACDVIDRQVTHMAHLIDDLLDASRIAHGRLALRMQTVDLAALARQTADDYRETLGALGLTLVIAETDGPAWVEGDPVRLAQMIANLLHNAGRFTNRGGRVEVRVAVDRADERAVLQVIDSGVGIEPRLLACLFDPFSQAQQDLARTKGGLGLGLAITRGLASLHGGEVLADSEGSGRGSTFTLRIPVAAARVEEPRRSPPPRRARARGSS